MPDRKLTADWTYTYDYRHHIYMHRSNANNKTFKIIPAFAGAKLFVPNASEVWLEWEIISGCPKALLDDAEGLTKIPQVIKSIRQAQKQHLRI